MLLPGVISLLVLTAIGLHYVVVAERRLIIGPETFFILLGTGTFAATQNAALQAGYLSHPYANFIGLGLLLFTLGTAVSRALLGFSHRQALSRFAAKPWADDSRGLDQQTALAIGWFALFVTVGYFYILGFFLPGEALRAFLEGGVSAMYAVYSDLRRATYATGVYLAPGYVYQFKNVILSLTTIVLYCRMRLRPSALSVTLFSLFLVSTILAATGAGRRYPLAFFAGAFAVIGVARYMRPLGLGGKRAAIIVLAALVGLSGLTLMMGNRGMVKLVDDSILWAPLNLLDRVVRAPAEERFLVYEIFLEDQDAQWGGGLSRQLEILLPGRAEYTLANELHEILYGSPTGNAGLDLWGSLWYDFHWYALCLLFLFGFFCNWYYVRLLRGPKRVLRVVTLSYAGLILAFSSDLTGLVNHGFLTCMLLLLLVGTMRNVGRSLGEARMRRVEISSAER